MVGDGQMAARCAKLVAEHPSLSLPMILHHDKEHHQNAQLRKVSERISARLAPIGNINDEQAVALLEEVSPDILFSINNWDIIRRNVLSIPADGVINFHNGPLPRYRGVNVPSWAIINRERRHGVSWHYVAEGVDAGDVVAADDFDLRPDETAISLTLRCIEAGVRIFPALLERYIAGTLEGRPQSGEAAYYSVKDMPNGGYLDFSERFENLSALVRGLTFRPFDNPFTWPKIAARDGALLVTEISYEASRSDGHWTCGEVREVGEDFILVCAADGLVRISGLMEENLEPVSRPALATRHGLTEGAIIARPSGT